MNLSIKNYVKDNDYIKKFIDLLFTYLVYFIKNCKLIISKVENYFCIILLDFGSDLEIAIKQTIINFFNELKELINNISKI